MASPNARLALLHESQTYNVLPNTYRRAWLEACSRQPEDRCKPPQDAGDVKRHDSRPAFVCLLQGVLQGGSASTSECVPWSLGMVLWVLCRQTCKIPEQGQQTSQFHRIRGDPTIPCIG